MPRVQLTFDAAVHEDPLAAISTELPDEEFSILSSHPTDDGILGLVELDTTDPETVTQHFEDAPEMSYEVLHNDGRTLVIQYLIPETESNRALRAAGILPRFPAQLQDGWLTAEHTASHERISQFPEEMDAAGIPYELQSITQAYDPSELLTARQHECITEAVERGYYDSPRGCTLTELAEGFGVNPSAVSGVLHRAEETIIKEAIGESSVEANENREPK
ncbi:helix-turn-helix domain-containing protein [Halocatena pleomorpha]|uniref:Helix-turn-helix domain-containing protein n=1 Tax=Halocatena pleomorpha TaxID=1785090 RepID=A0A3P3RD95_9EURY|nr:helix-turn-helix domain-containing protein [Halocatena pleomorpha]RRJ31385.1 helix-turn-helix domain-containing protein [Halocatena pleomorpha]